MDKIIIGVMLLVSWYLSIGWLVDFQSESILLNLILLPIRILAVTFWPLAGIGMFWLWWTDKPQISRTVPPLSPIKGVSGGQAQKTTPLPKIRETVAYKVN